MANFPPSVPSTPPAPPSSAPINGQPATGATPGFGQYFGAQTANTPANNTAASAYGYGAQPSGSNFNGGAGGGTSMLDAFILSVRNGSSGNTNGSISNIYGYGAPQNGGGANGSSSSSYLDSLISTGPSGFGGTSLQPGQTSPALPAQIPGTKGFFTYDLNGDGTPERYFEAEQDGQGYKKGDILVAGTGNSYLMNDPAMSGYYMQFYGNDDLNKDGRADPSVKVGDTNLRNIGQAPASSNLQAVFAAGSTAPVWFIPTESIDVNKNGTPEARYFMTDGTSILSSVFITGYKDGDDSDGAKAMRKLVEKIENDPQLAEDGTLVMNGQYIKVPKIEKVGDTTYIYVEGLAAASTTAATDATGASGGIAI